MDLIAALDERIARTTSEATLDLFVEIRSAICRPIVCEMFRGVNGDWYWRARHRSNGRIMATGAEGYRKRDRCLHGARVILGPTIEIIEVDE